MFVQLHSHQFCDPRISGPTPPFTVIFCKNFKDKVYLQINLIYISIKKHNDYGYIGPFKIYLIGRNCSSIMCDWFSSAKLSSRMKEEVAVVLSSLPYWLQPPASKSGRCIQFAATLTFESCLELSLNLTLPLRHKIIIATFYCIKWRFSVKNIIYLVDMSLGRQSRKPGHLHALQENQRQSIQDLFIFAV